MGCRQGDRAFVLDQISGVLEVIAHKGPQAGVGLELVLADVNEDWTGKGQITAVLNGLDRRHHRAFWTFDRQGAKLVTVGIEVGKTEVAKSIGIARNTTHKHVVIFAAGEVRAGIALIAVHRFVEGVKGA